MRRALLLLFIASCATAPLAYRSPLVKQILRARGDRLSNQACEAGPKGECKPSLVVYDLGDAQIRDTLVKSRFVCGVAGRRFRVCPDQPGLCRRNRACKTKFLGMCVAHLITEEYVEQSNAFTTLGVECRSEIAND